MFQTRTQAPPEGARLALELIGLRQDIDRLELRFSQVAVAYDKTEHWDQEGSNSAIDWIRFNCRMTSTAAADRLAVGKRLDQMAQSQQAMNEGAIGFAHLTVMARTADAVGAAFDEGKLLQLARQNSPGRFHFKCMHYRHSVEPKAYADEQAELAENRKLRLRRQPHPGPDEGLGGDRRGAGGASHQRTEAAGADRARQALPVDRLRAAGLLVRRTSFRPLDPRRWRRDRKPGPALWPPSLEGS